MLFSQVYSILLADSFQFNVLVDIQIYFRLYCFVGNILLSASFTLLTNNNRFTTEVVALMQKKKKKTGMQRKHFQSQIDGTMKDHGSNI